MNTEIIKVHPEYPEMERIAYCGKVIREGGLVIFPTETVYGIAADFNNPDAMRKLRDIKKRSEEKPFSILISQKDLISNYTFSADVALYKLINEFWPGPLTVVVPDKREQGKTLGIRMPDNIVALHLVAESQRTIAAPSANPKGANAPSTCQEALELLDGLVEAAIDGGTAPIGRGSTVVNTVNGKFEVLREGVITQEEVNKVIRKKRVLFICTGNSCRSVMAEYLLKKRLKDRPDVVISSAGTGVFLRSTASYETVSVLREEGIDVHEHISQPVNALLLKSADLIFVMTHMHRQQVLERVPDVEKRIYLLREFANEPVNHPSGMDIPDPMGKGHEDYKECLAVIKKSVDKIVGLI